MKKFFRILREQSISKWAFLILCTCCFVIARGELTAQASERVSFDGYPSAIIYTPVRSAGEVSAKDTSQQKFEMSNCSCIKKEHPAKKVTTPVSNGLAWGTISKVLPK